MKKTKQVLDSIDPQVVVKKFSRDPWSYFFIWSFILVSTIDYTVTDKLDHSIGNFYYVFTIGGFFLSLVTLTNLSSKYKFLDSTEWPILVSFNLIVSLSFIFVYPLNSPYAIFFALMMYITIYWKGLAGYAVTLSIQAVTLTMMVLANDLPVVESQPYYFASVTMVTSMAFGGVVYRLTAFDKVVRDEYVYQSRKINLERERLKSLINSVAVSVIATNKKGNILLHNGKALDIVNTDHSIVQKHINDIVELKDKNDQNVDIMSLVKSATGVISRDDFHIESDEEQEIAIRMTASPINATSIHRSDQGYIFLFTDITKEKSMDEQRDEFVHLLSHELRTPIAIVEGGISIAMEDVKHPLSLQQKTWLKRAHESTMYLSSLLNDLASLTKVDRANMKTVPMVTRPYNLLKRLCDDYEEQASKREITLEISKETTKDRLISSEIHIHEILQNFVSNAIKYTRENTIVTLGAKQSGNGVIFSVTDRGKGISKENQKQLFTKYFRSNDTATKKASGTGLGLYVSLKLAKRLGGKIWVESQLGSGTTFYLEAPNMIEKEKSDNDSKSTS